MTYSFQPFLDALDTNWFQDDALLARLLKRYAGAAYPAAEDGLVALGALTAGPLRALADESARPENAPYLRHFDAWNHRVDEIVLPASTHEALALVEGRHKLGCVHGDPFVHYAKCYLTNQNSEAGVGCSMACTDGMVRVLDELGDRPEHARAAARVRASTAERVVHGAQFVTEIQGGSDVPANELRAVPDGDVFRLFGQKWFCSNCNADYFVMTGRPDGAPDGGRGVALFLVPAFVSDDARERNGYRIERLKDKLGTRELATSEITFDGAVAYPLGPLDRGVANVVAHVLVTSRVACVTSAASALRQATRHIDAYIAFRSAFGRKLRDYPLVRAQAAAIQGASERALGALFELVRLWEADRATRGEGPESLDFRYLLSLCKPVLTRQATEGVHDAMMLLGGNGIEERFSVLPRLYRDSVIMETWEGPHNVLFTQAWRDMLRFEVEPATFVARVAGEPRPDLAEALGRVLSAGVDPAMTVPFARFAEDLVEAFGRRVVADVMSA